MQDFELYHLFSTMGLYDKRVMNPEAKEIVTGYLPTIYKDFNEFPHKDRPYAIFVKNGHKVILYQMGDFYILHCLEFCDNCLDIKGLNRIELEPYPLIDALIKRRFLYVMNHLYYKNGKRVM